MKKVVILGCENSHADSFLKSIAEKQEFSDVSVLGIYSDERAAAEKLSERFGVPIMEHYADGAGKVDGVIITARHGDNHLKYALPYIESGVPMFIDKPITASEDDVVELMKRLTDANTKFCGGSSLKQDDVVKQLAQERKNTENGKTLGGFIRTPYSKENNYGGFSFYAQHLVEMVCEIFGRFPLSVYATEGEGTVNVIFNYGDFSCCGLYCNENYLYYASLMTEKKAISQTITDSSPWFYREFSEFYELLSGGEQKISAREFASPVFIINAIERSLKSGKEEGVKRLEF